MRLPAFAPPYLAVNSRYSCSRICAPRAACTCPIRASASPIIDADKKRARSNEGAYPRGKDGDFRRVYVGDSPLTDSVVGSRVEIPRDEKAHLRVARVRPGSKVVLLNSTGESGVGELDADNSTVTVTATTAREKKHTGVVGVALCEPKVASRCDWTIEKLAELAVANAVVVSGGMRRMNPAKNGNSKRLERWKRIAVAAAKQSLADSVMQIEGNQHGLLDVVSKYREAYGKILLASPTGKPIVQVLQDTPANENDKSVLILIGPEGGTTIEEEEAMLRLGVIPVSLGASRLRVETAAIAAASILRCYLSC